MLETILVTLWVVVGLLAWTIKMLRDIQRALPAPVDPNLYRMTLNGEHRTLTLPEAINYWKFERAKHQRGSAMWSAYNRKLAEVGVND